MELLVSFSINSSCLSIHKHMLKHSASASTARAHIQRPCSAWSRNIPESQRPLLGASSRHRNRVYVCMCVLGLPLSYFHVTHPKRHRTGPARKIFRICPPPPNPRPSGPRQRAIRRPLSPPEIDLGGPLAQLAPPLNDGWGPRRSTRSLAPWRWACRTWPMVGAQSNWEHGG